MINAGPSVAIAILNWNGKTFLQTLLPQLQQLTYTNTALYVIDNNSSDDSVVFVKQNYPQVKLILLDANYGFAKGYNLGFKEMNEAYYLMLNSDVEITPNLIEPLLALMEKDSKTAICQPKILSLLNKNMFEHAGAGGGMIDFLGYPFCRGRIFNIAEEDKNQYNDEREMFWATGTCCLIKKEAYWKVGGLYDYYFMHMEEIDLCWRLNTAGYKIMYCPQSQIYHLGGGSLSYQSPVKTYYNFRNNIIMCFRNSPWYVNCWLLPLRLLMDLMAALHFFIQKNTANALAVAKAYKDFFKWLLQIENQKPAKRKSLFHFEGVLKKSIVVQFYILKRKLYSDI